MNNVDPLAIYRISNTGVPLSFSKPEEISEQEEEDRLNKYRIKPPEKHEEGLNYITRPISYAARTAETIAGLPGEQQRGVGGLLELLVAPATEYVTGKKQPELRKFLKDPLSALGKHRELVEELEKESNAPGESSIFTQLPTSEEIKENITKPASDYITGKENILEPSKFEKPVQESLQDFIRLSLPGNKSSKMARLSISVGSNLSKELAGVLGYEPSTQEMIKMGTMGLFTLAGIGNAPKFAKEYFNQVSNAMPRGVFYKTGILDKELLKIKQQDWYRLSNAPSTKAARELIETIEKAITTKGTMSARDGMYLRKVINEYADNLGAFAVEKGGKSAHIAHVDEVRKALIKGMEETLGKQYPKWWKEYQNANQAFAMTQKSGKWAEFISNNYTKPLISDAGKILFANILPKTGAGILKLGTSGIAIASGAKGIQIAYRVAKSPTLRKYYGQVVKAAAKQDVAALAKALDKFDQESLEEEKKEKAIKRISKY